MAVVVATIADETRSLADFILAIGGEIVNCDLFLAMMDLTLLLVFI